MLHRLIAVSVVSHIHHLHLPDLVDNSAVIAVVEQRRNVEYRIQHLHETVRTAHQIDQPLRVVKNAPGIVPTVPFRESVAPLQRRERAHKRPVAVAAAHQTGLRIEQVPVIHRPLLVQLDF